MSHCLHCAKRAGSDAIMGPKSDEKPTILVSVLGRSLSDVSDYEMQLKTQIMKRDIYIWMVQAVQLTILILRWFWCKRDLLFQG